MANWLIPDWGGMFTFDVPVLEVFLRGTVVYLALFLLLRVVLKRQAGNVSLTDMLLVVLIADASQNAMAAEYHSITAGLVLVGTLIFWDYALDWLSFRVPQIRALVHPEPLPLIRDGRILKANLRRELLTEEQLQTKLREQGVDDPRQVREAYMEGDGHVSVIKKEEPLPSSGGAEEHTAEANGPEEERPDSPAGERDECLRAARRLSERVRWHQQQIAVHEAGIAAIKDALQEEGFRVQTPGKNRRPSAKKNGRPAQPGAADA